VPPSQCAPAEHATEAHAAATQWPLEASQVCPSAQGAQSHVARQTPPSQTSAEPHVTPAHGSTHAPTRQTSP
jgi:hypothetical protein